MEISDISPAFPSSDNNPSPIPVADKPREVRVHAQFMKSVAMFIFKLAYYFDFYLNCCRIFKYISIIKQKLLNSEHNVIRITVNGHLISSWIISNMKCMHAEHQTISDYFLTVGAVLSSVERADNLRMFSRQLL